jgi:hypothetical protein
MELKWTNGCVKTSSLNILLKRLTIQRESTIAIEALVIVLYHWIKVKVKIFTAMT